ncbi:MAG: leucyl aminopeptidase family protein [Desulfovibrio sp.]|uniref:leucyl aminopeptidase family protein n=1 Tax=Desulfovibrio sp. 7SRBS1 TaxID=3378064 RepID=UPI003B40B895
MATQLRQRIIEIGQWKDIPLLFFKFEDEPLLSAQTEWAVSLGLTMPDWLDDMPVQPGDVHIYRTCAGIVETALVVAGLGKREDFCTDTLRQASAAASREARRWKLEVLGVPFPIAESLAEATGNTAEDLLREILAAAGLGLYRYIRHQPPEDVQPDPRLEVLFAAEPSKAQKQAVAAADAGIRGSWLARDLANTPPNMATPVDLEQNARHLCQRYGFSFQSYGPEELKAMNMGAFLSVAQGSSNEPRFLVLRAGEGDHPLVLVGKGVTFDSGGLSLKPPANMGHMKTDMAGAAAVIGFFEAYGALGLNVPVVGLVPCAENMPDGAAYRPSDVVMTRAGKSVEVISTDAEGRMLLCDALSYATDLAPSAVVDIATLTGACVIGLGMLIAGLFGTDKALTEKINQCGEAVGEDFWPLPLPEKYMEDLKSDVADFKHLGRREGGAIHAALFLKQFAPKGVPWAHLDIAGPGRAEKESGLVTKGASGFGVRTLLELARRS